MVSRNAQNVAREVLENLGKGKRIILGKIAIKKGYAQNTADTPQNITETKSYKDIVNPVVNKMIAERDRLIEALGKKKLGKEKYRDMIDGLDKLTKNIQLLTGGKTEDIGIGELSNQLNELIRSVKNDGK